MSSPEAKPDILIVGIGNDLRGDDSAGLLAARLLKSRLKSDAAAERSIRVEILESSGETTSLIDAWRGVDEVIIIDCSVSGSHPGTVRRIDLLDEDPRKLFAIHSLRLSSHSLDMRGALNLARLLNRLPARLTLYAIEGGGDKTSFEIGAPISDAVVQGVNEVARLVTQEIGSR